MISKYDNKVYMLPKHLDEKVARLHLEKIGVWELNRREQLKQWLEDMLREEIYKRFIKHPGILGKIARIKADMEAGIMLPIGCATDLVEEWLSGIE